jgi:hypothetical protein
MLLKAALKIINLFLALAAFLVVGCNSLYNGEELIWAVLKAVVTFAVCWLLINWFAGLPSLSVQGPESEDPGEDTAKETASAD